MGFQKFLCAFVSVYVLSLGTLYFFQRNIIYRPEYFYVSPRQAHADDRLREFAVTTGDGLHLKGWYAPATSKPLTLVFFHGNQDVLRSAALLAPPYISSGYGFLLAEYRGYSGMPGNPTETGLYADARAYVKALLDAGVPEKELVFFGQSLGTGMAVQMATEFKPAGLILVSPYLSMGKVAQVHFPFFPAAFLTKDRYENFKKIPTIKCPVLVVHGLKDDVVPFVQGKSLFALANEPKEFHSFPLGTHVNLFGQGLFPISLAWLEDRSRAAP